MKNGFFFLMLTCFFFFLSCSSNVEFLSTKDFPSDFQAYQGYKLVWSDEFNIEGLPDSSIWSYEYGYLRNNEMQFYVDKNMNEQKRLVYVKNGNLHIKSNIENDTLFSGSIHSYGKKHFKYGRIDVRAIVPQGKGVWPAIWMLGKSWYEGISHPYCGEIDIMEYVGYDAYSFHHAIHTDGTKFSPGVKKNNHSVLMSNLPIFYMLFSIEWTPSEIKFYINNVLTFIYFNDKSESFWRFDDPAFLILNLAIGGDWGGINGVDTDILPREFKIDYVRYYELINN